ncbi:hypothetical protein FRC04_008880 [Tulasnella sp. 424]|nr:hypothetical protein FRC04_008880 [Tulasnella sp. 424]
MDSVIEVQRQTHEEIERLERAAATLLSQPLTTRRLQIKNEHKVGTVLDRIRDRASTLHSSYLDDDNTRHAETTSLSTPDFTEFYARLKKIREYHLKYPDQPADPFELELAGLMGEDEDLLDVGENEDTVALLFSGEESFGRYLDLYQSHSAYNNLKNLPRHISYVQYLDILAKIKDDGVLHADLAQDIKLTKDFENKRTQPLVDIDTQQREAEKRFEQLWNEGQITGWGEAPINGAANGSEGVYCQKMYAKQTVYDAHLKSKKHIKAAAHQDASKVSADASSTPKSNGHASLPPHRYSKHYKAALTSHLIIDILYPLIPTIAETKSNVERRFALTAREREMEAEEPDMANAQNAAQPTTTAAPAEEEAEEEERIYNPLKLPLGWDGKPIPYWLYKLHGLGVEYRCEICSDAVYMGRKNFERHFQESRHAFGMRALGLPNTKHFHEITRIEDALSLAEKLKQEGRQEIFQNETMEEMEDEEGNVYNRKTYEDLKKQGII